MNARVLVVDDDPSLAEMLGIVLRGEGWDVGHCPDGSGALEAFRAFKPDVVLLDVMLPGLDGVQVCQQLRAESGVPIVMLTARTDTVDVVAGLDAGADDYITKPFKPQDSSPGCTRGYVAPTSAKVATTACRSALCRSISRDTRCTAATKRSR